MAPFDFICTTPNQSQQMSNPRKISALRNALQVKSSLGETKIACTETYLQYLDINMTVRHGRDWEIIQAIFRSIAQSPNAQLALNTPGLSFEFAG